MSLVRREHGVEITNATPGKQISEDYEVGMAFVHRQLGLFFVPTERQKNGGVRGLLHLPETVQTIRSSIRREHFDHWKLIPGVPRAVAENMQSRCPDWTLQINESFLTHKRYGR